MQLTLQIFEYEGTKVRTAGTPDAPLFVASDVCKVLGLDNPSKACQPLSAKQKGIHTVDTLGGSQQMLCITEGGLYKLLFVSRRPEAEKFQEWVTDTVLPQLRKKGSFDLTGGRSMPKFVQRFNDNQDRTDPEYFSVIGELGVRLYDRLERLGYTMPDRGNHGREMRPDVSVGGWFSKWLEITNSEFRDTRKYYSHLLPNGKEVEAYQYPVAALPVFISYLFRVWVPNHAAEYLKDKDPAALEFLPKLLPPAPVPPKAADNRFAAMRASVASSTVAAPPPMSVEEEQEMEYRRFVKSMLGRKPRPGEYLTDPEEQED